MIEGRTQTPHAKPSCRSCHAPIIWAVTENGKRMPVDASPTLGGTVLLQHKAVGEPPVAHLTSPAERIELGKQAETRSETLRLFVSHFATCPNAGQHRRAS